MTTGLGQHVLSRAIEKFGIEGVAARLGVRQSTVRLYAAGQRPVPDTVLLRAVDLLEERPGPAD